MARQRAAVAAAALVGVSVVTSSLITERSTATIDATLQENWRGAYDLLVVGDGVLGASAGATDGLIEQNFAAFTGTGGISLAELEQVRDIAGVEVAAPLSFLGQLDSPAYGVLVGATDTQGPQGTGFFGQTPRAFDMEVELRADDGVQNQVLSRTATTLVTARGEEGPLGATRDPLTVNTNASGDGRWSADVTLPGLPELSSGVVAVDPEAEQRLLGEGGQFLEPLVEFDRLQSEGASGGRLAQLVDPEYGYEHTTLASGEIPGPVMPVVVSDSAYTTITAHVVLTPVDTSAMVAADLLEITNGVQAVVTAQGAAALQSAGRGDRQQLTVDVTDRLVPFALPYLSISLPGADEPPGGTAMESTPGLSPELVTRSSYSEIGEDRTHPPVGGTALEVQPQGVVSVTPTAQEQTYRPEASSVAGATVPAFFAPVGTYTPGDVTGTADRASYVPLGTYSAGAAQVVQEGDHDGQMLRPSFSGRGVVLSAPGAITTVSAMNAVRPDARFDVLRVRVEGVQDYSAASVQRIEGVAAAIGDLGLGIRVVAGSSLEPVAVYVPQYFDDATDLGWTVQEWTSLGAAVRVEQATLGASAWLLLITLLGVTALAAASQASSISTRQRETALLASLGWSRSRTRAWFLAEGAVGVILVLVAAAVALVLSGSPLTRAIAAAAVVFYTALVIGAAWWATRAPATRTARELVPRSARTAWAIGARSAATRPTLTGLTGMALVVLTLTTTAFAAATVTAREAAGGTRLAALLSSRLLLPQLTLAVTAIAAAVILFVIGTRAFHAATTAERVMLAASGWGGGDIARAARATVIRATAPGALLAATLSLGLGLFLVPQDVAVVLAPAAAVLALAIAAALMNATTTSHRVVTGTG